MRDPYRLRVRPLYLEFFELNGKCGIADGQIRRNTNAYSGDAEIAATGKIISNKTSNPFPVAEFGLSLVFYF